MVTMTKEYNRNYYTANRERFLSKYNPTDYCEACSCSFQHKYVKRHLATKKHQECVLLHQKQLADPHPNATKDRFEQIEAARATVKTLLLQIAKMEKNV